MMMMMSVASGRADTARRVSAAVRGVTHAAGVDCFRMEGRARGRKRRGGTRHTARHGTARDKVIGV